MELVLDYNIDAKVKYYQKLANATLNAAFSIRVANNKQRSFLLNRAAYYMKQAGWLGDLWENTKKILRKGWSWVQAIAIRLSAPILSFAVGAVIGTAIIGSGGVAGLAALVTLPGILALLSGFGIGYFLQGEAEHLQGAFLEKLGYVVDREGISKLTIQDWQKIMEKPKALETALTIFGEDFTAFIAEKLSSPEGKRWLQKYVEQLSQEERVKLLDIIRKKGIVKEEVIAEFITKAVAASKDEGAINLIETVGAKAEAA